MTVIFDGKEFAKKKLELLSYQVNKLLGRGIKPKLVSILVGNDPGSVLYLNLKKKAGERVGAEVQILNLPKDLKTEKLKNIIQELNGDNKVHGVMVQLPLPESFSTKDRDEIIKTIDRKKDVDGLREGSPFLTPVVKAVVEVLKEAGRYLQGSSEPSVLVVGSSGFEGRKITKVLKEMGYRVKGADRSTKDLKLKAKSADILISATGVPNLIRGDIVKEGSVVIDVGAPKGDVETEEVMQKAGFLSPVPGGIGPVTISCLLENLVEAAKGQR